MAKAEEPKVEKISQPPATISERKGYKTHKTQIAHNRALCMQKGKESRSVYSPVCHFFLLLLSFLFNQLHSRFMLSQSKSVALKRPRC